MTLEPDYRDREFNTATKYTRMAGYIRSVRGEYVRPHARDILEDVNPGVGRYRYAAALTQHVFEEVEYSVETPLWRPDFVLDRVQKGDCEDHSTLLASLLTCRSFDIRYVVVDRADGEPGHVMVEVLFEDVDIGDLVDEARDFYNFGVERLCWESSDGGYWLACDGTASGVVGNKYSAYYDSSQHGEIDWRDGVRRDYLYLD